MTITVIIHVAILCIVQVNLIYVKYESACMYVRCMCVCVHVCKGKIINELETFSGSKFLPVMFSLSKKFIHDIFYPVLHILGLYHIDK